MEQRARAVLVGNGVNFKLLRALNWQVAGRACFAGP